MIQISPFPMMRLMFPALAANVSTSSAATATVYIQTSDPWAFVATLFTIITTILFIPPTADILYTRFF